MITTVFEGATIVDGLARPQFSTDIALSEDRIALIGDCSDREARRRFDCRGKIVAPGFIDACSHTGGKWLTAFQANSKSSQGITDEITGLSTAYFLDHWDERINVGELFALASRTEHGIVGTFFAENDVQSAIEAGAAGAAIDLSATPLDTAVSIAQQAANAGAPRVILRIRDNANDVVGAVEEAIAIAERASVHVHIGNHHVVYPHDTGRMERTLERIDRARTRGASITCDVAPYTATWIELASLLPAGVTPQALHDETLRAAVAMEMQARLGNVWHDVMLAEVGSEERMAWCGMRFDDIAKQTWRTPARAIVDFIAQEGNAARAFHFCLRENDVALALSADFCAVGTAAPSYDGREQIFGLIHPRAYGTFPRIFGRFVRQRRTLSLEEAVRRMTSLPSQIFGLTGRGVLREGAIADLVVFDQEQFVDTATYLEPTSLPKGLSYVFRGGINDFAPASARDI
ncbi:MAG: amidohydrolase family protein [Candidatus Eremiobacteraeota bacterium]|nr:amidohydrolase family protein [Candidatus Eremiobacteraeota bacterium]